MPVFSYFRYERVLGPSKKKFFFQFSEIVAQFFEILSKFFAIVIEITISKN